MPEPSYNGRKFRELLILLAERSRLDPTFGDTKLQKLLYWVDFGAYRQLGHAVTGARYKRFEHGPIADPFWREREELERVGAVEVEQRGFFGRKQKRTLAGRAPDLSVFSKEELALIEDVVRRFKDHNASDVRALSHVEAGWRLANDREVIPYETALLGRGSAPDDLLSRGDQLLKRYGW